MAMPELYIARRFIFSAKKVRVINVITSISILGIILGVMTLCIVLSVLNGFRGLVSNLFLTVDGSVQLIATEGTAFQLSDSLIAELRTLNGVRSAEPFVEGKVMAATADKGGVMMLKGMTPSSFAALKRFTDMSEPLTENSLVIGGGLAQKLGINVQNDVWVMSAKTMDKGLEALKNPLIASAGKVPSVRVSNFFRTHRLHDEVYSLTTVETARRLLGVASGSMTGVDIHPTRNAFGKPLPDEELKQTLAAWLITNGLQEKLKPVSMEEKYSDLYRVLKLEKWGTFAVLMLIVVVASLSLIGSLTMTAIEKKQDIYFLRCMGMTGRDVRNIFFLEGVFIGAIGVAVGAALGWLVSWIQMTYGVVKLPYGQAFIIKSYPVVLEWSDFALAATVTFLIAALASVYPATRAAQIGNLSPRV
jgi:lipoprotein-releasing system permease protein